MKAQTLENLFAAMQSSRGLPILETTVTAVLGSLHDVKKGNRDVVNHILEDVALTHKVLKLANSAMYAPFAKDTSSISSALNILGADALLHVVLSAAMVTAVGLEDAESLSKALLASELARSVCPDRLEQISIAALMYDLGRLMAAKFLPEEMAEIDARIDSGIDSDSAESSILGMTLQQIGIEVATRWKLPAEIISVIDGTGDPAIVEVARFSVSVSCLIHDGNVDEVNKRVSELDVPGLERSKLAGLIKRKVEEIATKAKPIQTAPQDSTLAVLLAGLIEEKRGTIEELAGAMFPTLTRSLEASHCLLFSPMKSGEYSVCYGYGKGIDELRSKLRISADFKPTAFHAAIKNNIDVSIADVSKLNASALPEKFSTLLPKVTKFLILPIAKVRVFGLVYLDWETDKEFGKVDLAAIRELRDLFLSFSPP